MFKTLECIAFGFGTTELLIVLGILVFFFGASKLPELGRSLGSGIRGFQKAVKGDEERKQLESQENSEETADDQVVAEQDDEESPRES